MATLPSRRRRDIAALKPKRSEGSATTGSDTPVEVDYYRNGGILHTVLRNMAKS